MPASSLLVVLDDVYRHMEAVGGRSGGLVQNSVEGVGPFGLCLPHMTQYRPATASWIRGRFC